MPKYRTVEGYEGTLVFDDAWTDDQIKDAVYEKYYGLKPREWRSPRTFSESAEWTANAAGRGIASGALGLGEGFAFQWQLLGSTRAFKAVEGTLHDLTGSDSFREGATEEHGRFFASYFNQLRKDKELVLDADVAEPLYRAYERGGFFESLKVAAHPRRLAFQLAEQGTQLAPMVAATVATSGLGAAPTAARGLKLVTALSGNRAKAVMAAKALSGIKSIGASIASGYAFGGGVEAAQTYQSAVASGATDEQALGAASWAYLGIGALNALPLEFAMARFSKGALAAVGRAAIAATLEATTEYAEEPVEWLALKKYGIEDDLTERLKLGLDVLPVAALMGGGLAAVTNSQNVPDTYDWIPEKMTPEEESLVRDAPDLGVVLYNLKSKMTREIPSADMPWIADDLKAKALRKKRPERGPKWDIFTDETTAALYLESRGIKVEDAPSVLLTNEQMNDLQSAFNLTDGQTLHAGAVFSHIVNQIATDAGEHPQAWLDAHIGGFRNGLINEQMSLMTYKEFLKAGLQFNPETGDFVDAEGKPATDAQVAKVANEVLSDREFLDVIKLQTKHREKLAEQRKSLEALIKKKKTGKSKRAAAEEELAALNVTTAGEVQMPARGTAIAEAGKLIFSGLTNPNITTAMHEFIHGTHMLTEKSNPSLFKLYKNILPLIDAKTDVEKYERIATWGEQYLFEGALPKEAPESLSKVLYLLREEMHGVYKTVREINEQAGFDYVDIPPMLKGVFNGIFSKPDALTGLLELQNHLLDGGLSFEPDEEEEEATRRPRSTERTAVKEAPKQHWQSSRRNYNFTHTTKREVISEAFKSPRREIERTIKALKLGKHVPPKDVYAAFDFLQRNGPLVEWLIDEEIDLPNSTAKQQAFSQLSKEFAEIRTNWASNMGQGLWIAKLMKERELLQDAFFQRLMTGKLTESQREILRDCDLGDLESVQNTRRKLEGTPQGDRWKRLVYSFFYTNLLSGGTTAFRNILSMVLHTAYQVPHKALLASADTFISASLGRPRHHYFGESFRMLRALGQVLTPGLSKASRRGLSTGKDVIFKGLRSVVESKTSAATKWEQQIVGPVMGFEDALVDIFGERFRGIGRSFSFFSNALVASDLYVKTIVEQAQRDSDMARLFSGGELNPAAWKAIMDEENALPKVAKRLEQAYYSFKEKPGAQSQLIQYTLDTRAKRLADHVAFQDTPGAILNVMMNARNTIPLARLIVPFVHISGTITRLGLEMIPVVGLAAARGHYSSRLEIACKQVEGLLIGLFLMSLVDAGQLTGSDEEDPRKRYCVKVGDRHISYRWMEPFALPFTLLADCYSEVKKWRAEPDNPAMEERRLADLALRIATIGKDLIIESGPAQGFGHLYDDKYGIQQQLLRTANGMMPMGSFWRTVNRMYEAETKGGRPLKLEWTANDLFGESMPVGLSQYLASSGILPTSPPKLSATGQPMLKESGWFRELTTLAWQDFSREDFVEKELQQLPVYPNLPGRVIQDPRTNMPMKLDDDIYTNYCAESGVLTKQHLGKLFRSRAYQTATEQQKLQLTERIVGRTRDAVRKKARYMQSKRNQKSR